jgi:hypothetical protein
MANTSSPFVEDRLIEEEMSDNRPLFGRQGVDTNVRALVERVELAGNPRDFQVNLFDNYPTFATLIVDDDIFVYPYGYKLLGTASPLFRFRNNDSPEARFFIENAARIVRDSVPATEMIDVRRKPAYVSPNWVNAGVFAIPRKESPFCQLGSAILGFDIYSDAALKATKAVADLRSYVGEAALFGFHMTLADALYFASESQILRVKAELQVLASDFQPFVLEGLHVARIAQASRTLMVAATESSGTVEAIHHELVARVYPLALSSNYKSGAAAKRVPRGDRRARLMLERYGSPFVLNAYLPRFTVCADGPEDDRQCNDVTERLESLLGSLPERSTEISELALVVKRPSDSHWKLEQTFPLCGPQR